MNYKKSIENIEPYKPGLSEKEIKLKYNLEKVVKLASNENPYGPSDKVKDINLDSIERYPDNYCRELRSKLSKKYNVSEDNLIFGNGSVEIIQMIARAFIESNDEVLTCSPTFQSYYLETIIEQGKMKDIPVTDSYNFDLNGLINIISPKTKVIYIANPNNPTGTIVTEKELRTFMQSVSKDILVVLDEAYSEFVCDPEYPDSVKLLKEYPNICVLKTFSKAYGLASYRVGYGISNPEIIKNLEKVRLPFNVSSIAQKVASIVLDDETHLKSCVDNNRKVIELLYEKLDENKINYIKTETNFIMIDTKKDGKQVHEKLLQSGFIVRPGFPGMDSYIRVTIGTESEMIEFVNCLKNIIKEI